MSDRTNIAPAASASTVAYAATPAQAGARRWTTIIGHLAALAVAAVFIQYAIPKIHFPRQFKIDVANYKILPDIGNAYLAMTLPWLEAFAAIALVIPRTRRAGALLVTGMLIVFIVAIAMAMSKGLDIECGCAGHKGEKAGWMTIGRDALLLAGTALAVMFAPRRRPESPA